MMKSALIGAIIGLGLAAIVMIFQWLARKTKGDRK